MNEEELLSRDSRSALPLWDAESDGSLICRAVRQETHDVKTFVFGSEAPRRFAFKPGQFLTFDFPIDGRRINRCYTISSSPSRPHLISITVKRVPGGAVSPWLHKTMRPGLRVQAMGPLGSFTFFDHPAPKYLFLSGGSGITPLMSMARWQDDLATGADLIFVHNAQSPADIIFRSELDLVARHSPAFRFVPICEADSPEEPWSGLKGRLSLPMLRLIAPDFAERHIFTCGPAPYMQAVRAMLAEAGFEMARYHEESFDFTTMGAAQSVAPAPPAPLATAGFTIELTKSRRKIVCNPDRFVLEAARSSGLRLPSSCTKGLCGTCKSKLLSGQVEMKHQGGIRQCEIDQGMILLCCSKPLSDLVIER